MVQKTDLVLKNFRGFPGPLAILGIPFPQTPQKEGAFVTDA